MALDRQTIEKRDFPIGRRGYEPEAVDAHLARVAEEVEQLRRGAAGGSAKSSPASIAQAASEQVRSIVEAAESSAAAIEQGARDEAQRIREDAEADARQTREEAVGQSQEHVDKVRQSTTQMLQRVDAMDSELAGLVESLRTGANRLTADLSLLEDGMSDLYDAAGRERPAAGPRVVESVPLAVVADEPEPAADADADAPLGDETVVEEVAVAEVLEVEPAEDAAPDGADADVDGARLVALNMALNGTPRAETDEYLAENFDLADRAGLLDEVYATVGS
ncbi:MAG TPA: DivIVA domain-containing protein [Baekduia sp.]|uniref:DivIVA domain-containing protein n=1 Tax=Baekduia sp. TaxID=2600305 RepID=UPI002BAF8665|nr:DivIVA domain-containing protein [Baekduia sp.]HMJ32855.1 DivIVA domain-containing protein [Baekduia sp.]